MIQRDRSGSATFSTNFFADLTNKEFASKSLGYEKSAADDHTNVSQITAKPAGPPAHGIDWRKRGVVTPVKEQG